jgi:hypothetical protein
MLYIIFLSFNNIEYWTLETIWGQIYRGPKRPLDQDGLVRGKGLKPLAHPVPHLSPMTFGRNTLEEEHDMKSLPQPCHCSSPLNDKATLKKKNICCLSTTYTHANCGNFVPAKCPPTLRGHYMGRLLRQRISQH